MLFDITYEIITPESAENGDVSDSGFEHEQVTLREAYDILRGAEYAESSEYPIRAPRWITFYKTDENYSTGEVKNMSLHFPHDLSAASRIRICRLFQIYGLNRVSA